MDLLGKMKFSIETMTMVEKFLAGIQVTVLGLVIVFIALAVLYFAVIIMEMLLNKVQETEETVESGLSADETVDLEDKEPVYEEENTVYDTELVAVIVAAVAASLHVPAQDVVVKSIKRARDSTPIWAKMGRIEQINNTL
ncbi:MAG: OadG family protein [Candidatus Alkaliphilus sp. MAG34]|nr:OadG family protein [Clostridiales bacterium]